MIRVTIRKIKPASFHGKHNGTKAKALILLENNRIHRGKGLTWRQLYLLGASESYFSLGVLLKRWVRWCIVSRKQVSINNHRCYIYRITKKGRDWLVRHSSNMPIDQYIDEIKASRERVKWIMST